MSAPAGQTATSGRCSCDLEVGNGPSSECPIHGQCDSVLVGSRCEKTTGHAMPHEARLGTGYIERWAL